MLARVVVVGGDTRVVLLLTLVVAATYYLGRTDGIAFGGVWYFVDMAAFAVVTPSRLLRI